MEETSSSQKKPAPKKNFSSLPARLFTASISLSILALALYIDIKHLKAPWVLSGGIVIIGMFCTYELYQMAFKCEQTPFVKWGVLSTGFILLSTSLENLEFQSPLFKLLISQQTWLCVSVFGCFYLHGYKDDLSKIFQNTGSTIAGFIYIGFLGSYIIKISWYYYPDPDKVITSLKMIGLAILTIKMTDIGAFFTGSLIGKHKWIPRISPGKSIEGLIGGMISATLLAGFLGFYVWGIFDSYWQVLVFGLVLSYCGQLADLIESMFKRAANMKDSANYLPGFGGFFDLCDSLIAGCPIAYFLYKVIL